MRRTIHKYVLTIQDETHLNIPRGARILSVQMQRGVPCVWALVDVEAPWATHRFRIIGTGHPVEANPGAFLGTIQLNDGALVFHVFDQGEDKGGV